MKDGVLFILRHWQIVEGFHTQYYEGKNSSFVNVDTERRDRYFFLLSSIFNRRFLLPTPTVSVDVGRTFEAFCLSICLSV